MFYRFLLMYMAFGLYLPLALDGGQHEVVGLIGFYILTVVALDPEG